MSGRGSDYNLVRLSAGLFYVTTAHGVAGMIGGVRGAWSAMLCPMAQAAAGLPAGTREPLGEAIRTQNEAAERVLAAYARHWLAAHPDPVLDPPPLFTTWEKQGAGASETAVLDWRYHGYRVRWCRLTHRLELKRDGVAVAMVRDAHEVQAHMLNYEQRQRAYWSGWLAP